MSGRGHCSFYSFFPTEEEGPSVRKEGTGRELPGGLGAGDNPLPPETGVRRGRGVLRDLLTHGFDIH